MIKNGIRTQEDLDNYEKTTVTAEDTWTDALTVTNRGFYPGGARVNVSIDPTAFVGTITLQRQYMEETTEWHDVDEWDMAATDGDIECIADKPEPQTIKYRMGCKTGDFTSGSAALRLGCY